MSLLFALALAVPPPLADPSALVAQTTIAPGDHQTLRADISQIPPQPQVAAAVQKIKDGKPQDALPIVDAIIALEERRSTVPQTIYYSARSLAEALVYAALADKQGRNSVVYNGDWATAYFLKGFALVDLERPDEAKAMFDRALELAPMNAHILAERAEWHKSRRDWASALADFEAAQSAAEFAPEDSKVDETGRALRGIAFVKVEQGEFDAAIAIIKQALKLNPADSKAREELDYIAKNRPAS